MKLDEFGLIANLGRGQYSLIEKSENKTIRQEILDSYFQHIKSLDPNFTLDMLVYDNLEKNNYQIKEVNESIKVVAEKDELLMETTKESDLRSLEELDIRELEAIIKEEEEKILLIKRIKVLREIKGQL